MRARRSGSLTSLGKKHRLPSVILAFEILGSQSLHFVAEQIMSEGVYKGTLTYMLLALKPRRTRYSTTDDDSCSDVVVFLDIDANIDFAASSESNTTTTCRVGYGFEWPVSLVLAEIRPIPRSVRGFTSLRLRPSSSSTIPSKPYEYRGGTFSFQTMHWKFSMRHVIRARTYQDNSTRR